MPRSILSIVACREGFICFELRSERKKQATTDPAKVPDPRPNQREQHRGGDGSAEELVQSVFRCHLLPSIGQTSTGVDECL